MLAKRITIVSSFTVIALVCILMAQSVLQEAKTEPLGEPAAFVDDRLLVKLEGGAPAGVLESLNIAVGARVEKQLPGVGVKVLQLPENLPVQEAVARYEAAPGVAYAEPDYLIELQRTVPDDPDFGLLYGLDNGGQTGGTPDADIDAPEAWQTTTGAPGTTVAVIDSGVDIGHPDLRDNIWTNVDEVPANGVDDDGNGYTDDVHGWDFNHDDASVYDDPQEDRHGTHVAGTIAAEGNNAVGVAGVSWRTRIMPLKIFGSSGTSATSSAVEALDYAVTEGIDISNNSWSGGGYSQVLRDAITRADSAGHLFVAAAGNSGYDVDVGFAYPATYDNNNIVSVTATDHDDELAWFSNYGARSVDLAAPGVEIWSTTPEGGYGVDTGTSMAAPHVAGTAALLESLNPEQDDARIKALLLQAAEAKPGLSGKTATGSRLNADAAVNFTGVLDESAPTVTSLVPKPGSKTRDRRPTIKATIRDDRSEIAAEDIELRMGFGVPFQYNQSTDLLTATPDRLPYGVHSVEVSVMDDEGNFTMRTWSFKVVR